MSFTATTTPTQLPNFGEAVLLVNNGTDTVYVGQRRDILKSDGFPIPPLSQLTLTSGDIYYIQAASSQQEVDVLPGAIGFSPSPAQIASQIVSSTLATAIANAIAASGLSTEIAAEIQASTLALDTATEILTTGVRQVDSQSRVDLPNFPAVSSLAFVTYGPQDCSGYQSFSMFVAFPYHAMIYMQWADSNHNVTMAKTWEVGSKSWHTGSAWGIIISDMHYGQEYSLTVINLEAGAQGAVAANANVIQVRNSNRNIYRENVLPIGEHWIGVPGTGESIDGTGTLAVITNREFGTLAASATSQSFECPLMPGPALLEVTGTTAAVRVNMGYGFKSGMTYGYALAAGQGSNVWNLILPRRPAIFTITNTTASAGVGYNVRLTAQPVP